MGRGSPAAELPPEEIIEEILLRLPPHPAFSPRVSLVCKHWLRLLRDPDFIRRFLERHSHAAPILGFFGSNSSFIRVCEPPNRIYFNSGDNSRVIGCRHGRVLLLVMLQGELRLEVWNLKACCSEVFPGPRTPLLYRGYRSEPPAIHGSLICVHDNDSHGEDCGSRPYSVVLLFYGSDSIHASVCHSRPLLGDLASLAVPYDVLWGDLASLAVPHDVFTSIKPGVLVGNAMYWLSTQQSKIVVFHLGTNQLSLTEGLPTDSHGPYDHYQIVKAGDGELGLGMATMRGSHLHLFALNARSGGTATWSEYRAVELDTVRLLSPPVKAIEVTDEDCNTVFLETMNGVFALQLETMEVNKVLQSGVVLNTMIACGSFSYRS